MRHGNKPTVTRYAQEVLPVHTTKRNISLEEEALLIDQAVATTSQIEQSLSESNRCTEMADALEDLAVVATDIQEATPTDISLVEAVAQMAVAGSDVDPHVVIAPPAIVEVPVTVTDADGSTTTVALETRNVKRIAVESIEESAEKIFEEVLETQDDAWDKIQSVFEMDAAVVDLKNDMQGLRERLNTLSSEQKPKEEELTLLGGASVFHTGGVPLTESFATLDSAASFIFETVAESVAGNGEVIAKALESLVSDDVQTGLSSVVGQLGDLKYPLIPGTDEAEQTKGPVLMGGQVLMRTMLAIAPDNTNALAALDRIRNSRIYLERELDAQPGELKIAVPSKQDLLALVSTAESLLDKVSTFTTEKKEKLASVGESLSEITEKLSEKLENTESSEDTNALRAAINLRLAYCNWYYNPIVVFYTKVFISVRAVRALVNKALDQHIEQESQPLPLVEEIAQEGFLLSIKEFFTGFSRKKDLQAMESQKSFDFEKIDELVSATIGNREWLANRKFVSGQVSGDAIVPYLSPSDNWDGNPVGNLGDLAAFIKGSERRLSGPYRAFGNELKGIYKQLGNQDPANEAALEKAWKEANASLEKINHPGKLAVAIMQKVPTLIGGMECVSDESNNFNPGFYELHDLVSKKQVLKEPKTIPALTKEQVAELAIAIQSFLKETTKSNNLVLFNVVRLRYAVGLWKDGDAMKGTRVKDDEVYRDLFDTEDALIWNFDAECHQSGDPSVNLYYGMSILTRNVMEALFRWINRSIVS